MRVDSSAISSFLQEGDQRGGFAGRHEDVYMGKTILKLRTGFDADHATHQRQGSVGTGLLPGLEIAGFADALVFRALSDYAGIEYDDIGLVNGFGGTKADPLQLRCHLI